MKNVNLYRGMVLALLLGSSPAMTLAQTAPAQTAPAPATTAPAEQTLAQIPGVTVQYYDVTGKNIKEINASITKQSPGAAGGKAVPSSSSWAIGTTLNKATTGNQCKVTGATAKFSATVTMPRLVNAEQVPAPVLKQWQAYVAGLDSQQAATLRRPYDRLREVEQAAMASTCEGAQAAVDKTIATIAAQPAPAAAPAG